MAVSCPLLKQKMIELHSLQEQFNVAFEEGQKSKDFSEATKIKKQLEEVVKLIKAELVTGTKSEQAAEIMGKSFLGAEAVKKTFGIELNEKDIPPIMYTPEQLQEAEKRGEMLVLRVAVDKEGKPMTAKNVNDIVQPTTPDNKVLLAIDWYAKEKFFTDEALKTGWKLVSKEVIADSKSKNYIDQTLVLREFLKEVNALTDEELSECSDQKLKEIKILMGSDKVKAAQQLASLKINQNHRRTMVEAIYDTAMRFKSTSERVLENTYDWTKTLSSGGDLVFFAGADSRGAGVSGYGPGRSDSGLGLVSSR